MDLFIIELKRAPRLLAGLILLTIGITLMKTANVGMNPWGVFHFGLANATKIDVGIIIQLVGFIILILSIIFVKVKVGLGTILNILIVGNLLRVTLKYYTYIPNSDLQKYLIGIIGLLLITFGRSLYISADLGAGPRDALFVGLSRMTKIDVKYIKPMIEFTVLIIGFLLGEKVGLGTVVSIVASSYLVNMFLLLLGFDPKKKKQSDITLYFKKRVSNN